MFRVYAQNEKLGISTFINACSNYRNTSNVEFQKYWDDLIKSTNDGKFTIMKNTDFLGIRKI